MFSLFLRICGFLDKIAQTFGGPFFPLIDLFCCQLSWLSSFVIQYLVIM